jgi:hypothetical protein
MLDVLVAMGAMAFKDALEEWKMIAAVRGRATLAGALDAAFDVAQWFVFLAAPVDVAVHGWTWHTILVMAAMVVTSFFGTRAWTKIGQRIKST